MTAEPEPLSLSQQLTFQPPANQSWFGVQDLQWIQLKNMISKVSNPFNWLTTVGGSFIGALFGALYEVYKFCQEKGTVNFFESGALIWAALMAIGALFSFLLAKSQKDIAQVTVEHVLDQMETMEKQANISLPK